MVSAFTPVSVSISVSGLITLYRYDTDTKTNISEYIGLDHFYGLEIGLKVETLIISVPDSVSTLRLRKIQSRPWS